MAKSGYTKEINSIMNAKGLKGYIKWNDGSVSFYPTRAIAKKELRRESSRRY